MEMGESYGSASETSRVRQVAGRIAAVTRRRCDRVWLSSARPAATRLRGSRPASALGAAEIWSGRPGVFGCPGALGRYLASTGRQFGADLNGEVQVRLTAGHLLQAFGDERSGLGNVTAAFGEPRAQEDEFRSGERRAGDEPVKQFVLGCAREPVEEHLVPHGEVVRP